MSQANGTRQLRTWTMVALLLVLSPWPATATGDGNREDLIGEPRAYRTAEGDTLLRIAREHGLGFVELLAANPGVDPWIPGEGLNLLLPSAHLLPEAPRQGIVINLADLRLYYFPPAPGMVASFPLGIGQTGWETPVGRTKIVRKRVQPTWVPPPSIRAAHPELPKAVPPGPANPLGKFALNLAWRNMTIHGTNKPLGIGRRVSHGCIRLYPEDIAWLFDQVSVGTPVTIVDQPIKTGWSDGELYLEVHPTQSQVDELESRGHFTPQPISDLDSRLRRAAGSETRRLDWPLIYRLALQRRGIPLRVTW